MTDDRYTHDEMLVISRRHAEHAVERARRHIERLGEHN